jgi:UPF0755 protein
LNNIEWLKSQRKVTRRKSKSNSCATDSIFLLLIMCVGLSVVLFYVPSRAARIYGPPAPQLSLPQRVQYSALLLWYDALLTQPLDLSGQEQVFVIQMGESVSSVANHLEAVGLIRDAESLRSYLIYSGLDTSIQAGEYQLSTAMSAMDIAHELQDATPEEVTFVVLPGWRVEEVAASLATSGLPITQAEFLAATKSPPGKFDFLQGANSVEGFLFPDSYVFSRNLSSAEEMIDEMVRNFAVHLTSDLTDGFQRQGLSVYQAVTLASMVEREAVQDEEQALIASVYLNRLNIGMKLDADPDQYG